MWGLSLVSNGIRKLFNEEIMVIVELYQVIEITTYELSNVYVQVINKSTGTIRSIHLTNNEGIKARSSCAFKDKDGIYVEVILFLDASNKFAELYIWKVNDEPLINFPNEKSSLINRQKI